MHNENLPTMLRRSSRVPAAVPILVTSLEGPHFSEVCETVVVNAHGCALLSPIELGNGVPLRLHSREGRETTAHVVFCQPAEADNRSWKLGARLDRPDNFWGLNDCPADWTLPAIPIPPKVNRRAQPSTGSTQKAPVPASHAPEVLSDLVARQLEAPVKRMIAEAVRPLQAEVTAIREKLALREANPSRFEVSLSSIPPELERQLEARLRKDLGPTVLEEARQQYAHLLEAGKASIEQRTTDSYEDFLRRVAEELKAVEKKAEGISTQISERTQEGLDRALQDLNQKLLDGGTSLKRFSEELLAFLQQNSNEEYRVRCGELERLRASVASESFRLQEQVEQLNSRISNLDESARSLESGLDHRLSQMSSNFVKDTRGQLESVANDALEQFTTRSHKSLESQMNNATESMKVIENEINSSVFESLKTQATNALQSFERSMESLTKHSVERWQHKLAIGLTAVANSLGHHFQLTVDSDKEADKS